MAKKNGKDPLVHLVELMTEQVAETRLIREEMNGLSLSVVEVRDEVRTMNGRISNVVDRVSRLALGRMVEFSWVGESGSASWHPAVVLAVYDAPGAPRGVAVDLEVFGVNPTDPRRLIDRAIFGENAGCWRFPDA